MSSDFFSSPTVHRARKEHCCVWCGEGINQGETYKKQSGVFYGDFFSNKYHPECLSAMGEAMRADVDGEFTPYENPRPPKGGE